MSERWNKIEQLYHAASALPESERQRYLAAACGDDPEMQRDVEALLAQDSGTLLERRTWLQKIGPTDQAHGDLPPGFALGPYRIQKKIGAGGMGAVYKASDSRLG